MMALVGTSGQAIVGTVKRKSKNQRKIQNARTDSQHVQFNGKKPKIALCKLDKDTILIEGNEAGLKWLASILIDVSNSQDCGNQVSRNGAGSRLFSRKANLDYTCTEYLALNTKNQATDSRTPLFRPVAPTAIL